MKSSEFCSVLWLDNEICIFYRCFNCNFLNPKCANAPYLILLTFILFFHQLSPILSPYTNFYYFLRVLPAFIFFTFYQFLPAFILLLLVFTTFHQLLLPSITFYELLYYFYQFFTFHQLSPTFCHFWPAFYQLHTNFDTTNDLSENSCQ